ncbi:hypothetical protein V8D89_012941 [Ganoderma adspersum]
MASTVSNITNSDSSELAKAVPLEERSHIPDNKPTLPDHQKDHIPIGAGEIDYDLWEVLQKPYIHGHRKEKEAKLRIPYFPSGFTVGAVLRGDLSEVSDADELVHAHEGSRPEKTAVRVEGGKAHMGQRRTPSARGRFATLAAEEIKKIIDGLTNFPYTLDEIKVLSIDVRSRGTVQPRIFVKSDAMPPQDE